MRLIYRFHIYRRGVFGTPYNVLKLAILWTRFGLEQAVKQLSGSRMFKGQGLVAPAGFHSKLVNRRNKFKAWVGSKLSLVGTKRFHFIIGNDGL